MVTIGIFIWPLIIVGLQLQFLWAVWIHHFKIIGQSIELRIKNVLEPPFCVMTQLDYLIAISLVFADVVG